jgi:four helix bundle protein
VAALIVEGYGRKRYKADFIKYLVYAIAECDETCLHIEFIYETGSLKDKQTFIYLKTEYHLLGKKLNRFIQWADNNWNVYSK